MYLCKYSKNSILFLHFAYNLVRIMSASNDIGIQTVHFTVKYKLVSRK